MHDSPRPPRFEEAEVPEWRAASERRPSAGATARPPSGLGRVRFGPFEADVQAGRLGADGRHIRLQRQVFELLVCLLERPGELVAREELCARLWPDGTYVDFEHV